VADGQPGGVEVLGEAVPGLEAAMYAEPQAANEQTELAGSANADEGQAVLLAEQPPAEQTAVAETAPAADENALEPTGTDEPHVSGTPVIGGHSESQAQPLPTPPIIDVPQAPEQASIDDERAQLWARVEALRGETLDAGGVLGRFTINTVRPHEVRVVFGRSGLSTYVTREQIESLWGRLQSTGELSARDANSAGSLARFIIGAILAELVGTSFHGWPLRLFGNVGQAAPEPTIAPRDVAPLEPPAQVDRSNEGLTNNLASQGADAPVTLPPEPVFLNDSTPLKVHVEIYIASRLLGKGGASFSIRDLTDKVSSEFQDHRQLVRILCSSSSCVANRYTSGTPYNYLWAEEDGRLRCFDPERDQPHRLRVGRPTHPKIEDMPREYLDLLPQTSRTVPPDPPGALQTLTGLEQSLKERLGDARLLAELELEKDDVEAIADRVAAQTGRYGMIQPLRSMAEYQPRVYAALLAYLGRHVYQQEHHTYWPAACKRLGLPSSALVTDELGRLFVSAVQRIWPDVLSLPAAP